VRDLTPDKVSPSKNQVEKKPVQTVLIAIDGTLLEFYAPPCDQVWLHRKTLRAKYYDNDQVKCPPENFYIFNFSHTTAKIRYFIQVRYFIQEGSARGAENETAQSEEKIPVAITLAR
jgi:hypothetical protein